MRDRSLLKNMGVEDPVELLDEGRFIRDFPGYMIYVGKRRDRRLKISSFMRFQVSMDRLSAVFGQK